MIKKTNIPEVYVEVEASVPKFMSLSSDELLQWCINRYNRLKITEGMTHQILADLANMPKGTVDRILSGNYKGYRYDTIQPLVAVLLGQDDPVPEIDPGDETQVQDLQETLEGYQLVLQEKNEHIPQMLDRIKALEEAENDAQKKVDYLKSRIEKADEAITKRDKMIVTLLAACGVLALFIMVVFSIDILVGSVGWFRF